MLLDPQMGGTAEVTKMINKEVINKCHRSHSAPVPKLALDMGVSVRNNFPCGWELDLTLGCEARTGKN